MMMMMMMMMAAFLLRQLTSQEGLQNVMEYIWPIRLVDGACFYSNMKLAIHLHKIKDLRVKEFIHFLVAFFIQSIINLMVILKAAISKR